MRRASLLISLVVSFVPAVGCSDDDSNESSARAETISRQQYIARSNAVCERTGQKADAAFNRMVGQQSRIPRQERAFLVKTQRLFQQAAIPAIRGNVERRRALPTPDGEEQAIDAIMVAGQRALAGFEQIGADRAKLRALFEGDIPDPARRFDALSRSYGIDKCGGDK
jgi:hypothetical protein